jgi:hypothetical protein
VPAYRVSIPYPAGTQVQDVLLVEKSAGTSGEGLLLGGGQIYFTGERRVQPELPTFDVEDWPAVDFDWWVEQGMGQNLLVISIYPLRYHPLTTMYSYYQRYVLTVELVESPAAITRLALDSPAYGLGDSLQATVELDGGAVPAGEVYLHMQILDAASRQAAASLPLRELYGLQGPGSYTAELSSAGLSVGDYCLVVHARQADGASLDEEQTCFRLGVMQAEPTLLSASKLAFTPGEAVNLSLSYANLGDISLQGQAVLQVRDLGNTVLHTWTQEISALAPGGSGQFVVNWNTAGVPGGSLVLYGYLSYDGQTTAPLTREMRPEARLYLPQVTR